MNAFNLFKYDGWEQADTLCLLYHDCAWLVDFGPWKAGDVCETIVVDLENLKIEEISSDQVVHSEEFRLIFLKK